MARIKDTLGISSYEASRTYIEQFQDPRLDYENSFQQEEDTSTINLNLKL